MKLRRFVDVNVADRRVFIRADFNVPQDEQARITDDTRIRASLPAIQHALVRGAAVMVTSHLGRPKEGEYSQAASLAPVAKRLSELLGQSVPLLRDYLDGVDVSAGHIVVLENCRFNKGEKGDCDTLARKYAALCDIYVNDAFGTAHRAEASTHGVAKFAKIACAGPLLSAELDALARAWRNPAHPLVAIVGGSKVSSKLTVLKSLAEKVDQLIVGGGIANTFLAAAGKPIGKSLSEPDLIDEARVIMALLKARGAEVPLPVDVVCAKEFSAKAIASIKRVDDVEADDMILDVGPLTAAVIAKYMQSAGTIVWNGPLGVFEYDQFGAGTSALAAAIASSKAFSIAGGGDTLAAITKYGVTNKISYISTGGGAFLEFLEGQTLPAVEILEQRLTQ